MAELIEKAEWTDGIYQLETSDPVVGGPGGISNRQAQELAYRTLYLKNNQEATSTDFEQHKSAADPHTQYAPKLNPTFSGTPKAPTPASDSNSDQLATTAFVKSIVAALVDGSPAALDTLKELSAALGNDANFASTVANSLAKKAPSNSPALSGIPTAPTAEASVSTTQIATTAFVKSAIDANFVETVSKSLAGKMSIDQNGADIADTAQFRENLGLGEGSALPVGTPIPWPSASVPAGWLQCNGSSFTAAQYPKLAQAYPELKLPDLRGEFIRGWDSGRGVDGGRALLAAQGDAIRNITGFVSGAGGMYFDGFGGAFYDSGARNGAAPSSNYAVSFNDDIIFDASRSVPTAAENRPRNIAFNYIVRAA
ncbi:phage tail protein [Lonsdalea quercina]|uniref:phage tail protein n=1 Tax=Lonsdalea quercina TaxID=71657 RepID=UPI003976CE74